MVVLKKGDKGADVKRLQILLNSMLKHSPKLRPDGDFGPRTHDAVVRFQKSKGLVPDGIVGPKTWKALGQNPIAPPSPPTPPAVGASWMDIAVAELGVHENALPGQHNQRIIEYHSTTTLQATRDETPWCSSFVNWAMIQVGYQGTNNALARSWLNWGRELASPRQGAITVIKRRSASQDQATGSSTGFHVSFYVSSSATHVRLLGGNQSDRVRYSNFSLSTYEVKGYRWPA